MSLPTVLRLLAGDPAADAVVPPSGATGHLTTFAAAAVAFLCAVALIGALAADRLAERWTGALSGAATVTIATGGDSAAASLDRVALILGQTPGVSDIRPLSSPEVRALIAPWLGDTAALADSDLPAMLALREGPGFDAQNLISRLEAEVPDAVLHLHRESADRLTSGARRLQLLALLFVSICLAVMAVVITLAARAALALNAQVILTLRLIGAKDTYIARAFVRRFTLRGLSGATMGTASAVIVLILLSSGSASDLAGLLPDRPGGWLTLAVIPALTALLAFAATRRAAFHVLNRLP